MLLEFVQYAISEGWFVVEYVENVFAHLHICYRFSWWNGSASAKTFIT